MIRLERERERLFLTREEEISFPQLGYLIFLIKETIEFEKISDGKGLNFYEFSRRGGTNVEEKIFQAR